MEGMKNQEKKKTKFNVFQKNSQKFICVSFL